MQPRYHDYGKVSVNHMLLVSMIFLDCAWRQNVNMYRIGEKWDFGWKLALENFYQVQKKNSDAYILSGGIMDIKMFLDCWCNFQAKTIQTNIYEDMFIKRTFLWKPQNRIFDPCLPIKPRFKKLSFTFKRNYSDSN